jgi:hypothetical protein
MCWCDVFIYKGFRQGDRILNVEDLGRAIAKNLDELYTEIKLR